MFGFIGPGFEVVVCVLVVVEEDWGVVAGAPGAPLGGLPALFGAPAWGVVGGGVWALA